MSALEHGELYVTPTASSAGYHASLERQLVRALQSGDLTGARVADVALGADQCRVCGCTDNVACMGGCWWADEQRTLCTRCSAAGLGVDAGGIAS